MVYCCVPYCKSNSSKKGEHLSFHSFPADPVLKEKWRIAISRQGEKLGSLWSPRKSSKVCNLHFKDCDFSLSTTKRQLLPNSVPSVFIGYPANKQKGVTPVIERRKRHYPKPEVTCTTPNKIRIQCSTDNDNENVMTLLDYASRPTTNEIGIQVSFPRADHKASTPKAKYILKRKSNYRLRQTIRKLRKKIKDLKSSKKDENSAFDQKVNKIRKDGENGEMKALFLLEQIDAYGKKYVRYGETTLKISVLWQRKSPTGYRFIRSLHCLRLPHQKTLKNYVGFSNGETGITSLIKQRLHYEVMNLTCVEEKLGSLIIDEMAIKPRVHYDRNLDRFLGYSEAELEESGLSDRIANRLLCFLFRGLSTSFRIPVAFYFTRQLTGTQLLKLTLKVLSEVEDTGFQILRLVTDNCTVNVNMMKDLCNGTISPEIQHPNDQNRPLFLSFDSSHVLKNIRSQFLQKDFFHEEKIISSIHIKKLYNIQRQQTVKPVRGLTRKIIFPSNLEKMNVKSAKFLFSACVTGALKTLPIVAPEAVSDMGSLDKTIEFMEHIRKWHDIHDVCNITNIRHSYMSRNADKMVFMESDDERLKWLEDTFLPYVEEIQKHVVKRHRISQETYEALVLTTKSTVQCIKYLLSVGFHYILSRNLNSDDIELLFSHLRRRGGFNDMMDVRSCIYAMETTLITGMINPSDSSNVERQAFRTSAAIRQKESKDQGKLELEPTALPATVLELLNETLEEKPVTLELSSLAMIGGYLVRVAEENSNCESCLGQISSATNDSPLMCLIRMQDRGALRYPSRKFVYFLQNTLNFTRHSVRYLGNTNLVKKLNIFVVPKFTEAFKCDECDQSALAVTLITKLLKPILDNEAHKITDAHDLEKNFRTKPLSRKVLKV